MSWFKSIWDTFFGYMHDLFENHKFVRRTVVFVALATNIWICYRVLDEDSMIILVQSPHGTGYALLIGHLVTMNTGLIALYKWLRERQM